MGSVDRCPRGYRLPCYSIWLKAFTLRSIPESAFGRCTEDIDMSSNPLVSYRLDWPRYR
jgi:hypothetical protein